jgi:hypothetical protein
LPSSGLGASSGALQVTVPLAGLCCFFFALKQVIVEMLATWPSEQVGLQVLTPSQFGSTFSAKENFASIGPHFVTRDLETQLSVPAFGKNFFPLHFRVEAPLRAAFGSLHVAEQLRSFPFFSH